jgi:hypothetical protein
MAPTSVPPPSTVSAEYPTLVIDEQHRIRGSDPPVSYQIAPAAGIRLDAGQFHFTIGDKPITPNMVQITALGSLYRLTHLAEANNYVIDKTTLDKVRGEPFGGFRRGDKVMFVIGRSTKASDQKDFWISWSGQIEVK